MHIYLAAEQLLGLELGSASAYVRFSELAAPLASDRALGQEDLDPVFSDTDL